MLTSGDIVELDLGSPAGREAGFYHPAVVVTARRVLEASPNVIHVVPLTTTLRDFSSEVVIEPDEQNGLTQTSAAQCHQIRAVASGRVERVRGNVGSTALAQVRDVIALLLDLP